MADDTKKRVQSRKWLLTINNPLEHDMNHEQIKIVLGKFKGLDYWCMCDEVGEKGTYHTHVFMYKQNPIEFTTIKNRFPVAHIDYCRGTCQENRDYVRKEGAYKDSIKAETNLSDTFEESGVMPIEKQGRRNDLIKLYECIKEGYSDFEILEENPEYMLQLDKISHCRQIIKAEQFKKVFRHLEVFYHYGETGSGKTKYVMERYGYENVYRITDYKHPFDNYKGEDVVVFEEFRSSLRIQDMLNYLDGYPLNLPCRYNNKVACFTKVYIITNIALDKQYTDVQKEFKETWLAFLRRITGIKQYQNGTIIDYDTVDSYLHRWTDTEDFEKENNTENLFTNNNNPADQKLDLSELELFADAQVKSD